MPTDDLMHEDLLHMLPSNNSMNQAREVLQDQLSQQMEELQKVLDWSGQGYIDSGEWLKVHRWNRPAPNHTP